MSTSGSIQFRVFTSNANIPIQGATVIVRAQNPPYTLFGIQITDTSGQTEVLKIPTGDTPLGQTPVPGEQPWINLIAYIEHPEYEEAAFRGLQLFPGIMTIQNVQLIPNQYYDPTEDDLQEFNTSPQPVFDGGSL